jgi:putative transposase
VLKEAEAGAKPKDLCRKHGISDETLYNWQAKYGGTTVSEARRLSDLAQENARLKRLLAEAELERQVPGRVPDRPLVHQPEARSPGHCSLARGVQHGADPQLARRRHPGGVRRGVSPARGRGSIFNCGL